MSELTIGIDIGGTKVVGGVVDADGTMVAQARRETPAGDTGKTLDFIVEVVEELAGGARSSAVGIGAAGWIDASRSRVLFAPNLAWRDEPLRESIADRVNLPVVVENDGNVAAWAEFRYGAARDADRLDGAGDRGHRHRRRHRDRRQPDARRQRHRRRARPRPGRARRAALRLRPAGLPGAVRQRQRAGPLRAGRRRGRSGRPRAARAGRRVDRGINGPLVTRAARHGDPAARAAFAEIGRWLGSGLADIVQQLDPEVLVVGGGVVEAGEAARWPRPERLSSTNSRLAALYRWRRWCPP